MEEQNKSQNILRKSETSWQQKRSIRRKTRNGLVREKHMKEGRCAPEKTIRNAYDRMSTFDKADRGSFSSD